MTGQRRFYALGPDALVLVLMGGVALSACSSSQTAAGGTGGSAIAGGQNSSGGASTQGGSSVSLGASSAHTTTSVSGGTGNAGGAGTGGVTVTGSSAVGGATNQAGSGAGGHSALGGSASGGASAAGGSATGAVVGTGGKGTGGSSVVGSGGSTEVSTGGSGGVGTGGSVGSGVGGSTKGGASATAGATTGGTKAQGGATNASGGQGGAGGGTNCTNRVVSMSANGTNSDSDSAYAHVEVDLKTDLPIANAKRTVEFWMFVKTTDWVGDKNEVYYYGVAGSTATAFGLDFGTNPVPNTTPSNHATLDPFTDGGFSDDSTNNLGINSSSDQWVHVAMVWDAAVLKTYVNGLPKITTNGSGGITALATGQSALLIGCNPENKACFNGYFSDFRVWNVARADADIKDNYNRRLTGSEAGLVAYLKLDEAAGSTTAADSVTVTGHTAHVGTLKADTAAHNPTFITPSTPVPLSCH